MLTQEENKEIDHELALYERRQAACIEALKIVQKHRGWISDESIRDIAEKLEMSVDELDGVATFYNLIYRRPVGRHVIHVCDSVSCWLTGYEEQLSHLKRHLGVSFGQTTSDARFTLLPIPCLGACDRAPAMMIDGETHGDLSPGRIDQILERYE
ncbi:MAG: NADH-quinone oxidoreductase subunit NuoE [Gammaproteobacteria bacterium]|nr:NADH-quinone oxidoreductase subunit NuoE [Gammaproteobacteria bacterium]NIR82149.1 NADH-quinone oxidoreductase subunit NuoE [Gammaproteobacteria bacterium]NIR90337.1 NADH-quinone oxidoreductase subunit NuoE [Gammaproteobacteria bacterium]NIV75575.1 NADH-quinone oxidoreductase subunit NuoE [Gammaproteobacteria bacterium]NIX04717.1 NADH-quinone oxidoreductase subunit NuoE [Gammaproteobacteria bacterium]